MKLNEFINENNMLVEGFPAFKELAEFNNTKNKKGMHILSTLAPAQMLSMYATKEIVYYTPVISRNSRFSTAEEIVSADLDVIKVKAYYYEKPINEYTMVCKHQATIEYIKKNFNVVEEFTGDVTVEDIMGKGIVGALPASLIQYANSITSIIVKDYNAAVDGDMSAEELENRIIVGKPIKLEIIEDRNIGGGN